MELHHTAVKEETGFTAVEMLLSLIIVVMITFVGYYIYNTQKTANATYKAVSNAAQASVPKSTKKAVASGKDNPTTPFYLVIKEWGVRVTLPSAITDAKYAFSPGSISNEDSFFAGLGTVSLTKLSANCSPETTGVGGVARQNTTSHDANVKSQAQNGSDITNPVYSLRVGNYYYQYVHAQAACYETSNTAAASYFASVKPDQLLKQAVGTIEASN